MIGTIIGDIAGSIYEFDNTDDYNFPLFSSDKEYTDDTICAIAVADAAMSEDDYGEALRRWCRRYPDPMGAYGGYFQSWIFRPDPAPYNSFGNGSAMRVSSVAWLFNTEESVREEAEKSAAVTHNHPEGIKGAVAIAVAIFRMRNSADRNPEIFNEVAREFYGEECYDNLPEKGEFDVTCQGCVPLALYIASRAESFEDAVRQAVVYGGDADTLGAIVGSLAEARFGVPEELRIKAMSYLPPDMKEVVARFESRRQL